MQYEITLTQVISETVRVFAPNKDAALNAALLSRPGMYADAVTEIIDGEPGETHDRMGTCERCGKGIWDDDEYVSGGDDEGSYCVPCYRAMSDHPAVCAGTD